MITDLEYIVIFYNVPRQAFSNWRFLRKASKTNEETRNYHEY